MSRLLLKNCIGEIYEDKIILDKKEIYPSSISSINILKSISKEFNIILFLLSFFFLLIAYMKLTNTIVFYISLTLCAISLLISAFYTYEKYYLIVTFSIDEPLKIHVKKKDEKEAKLFLKKTIEIKNIS